MGCSNLHERHVYGVCILKSLRMLLGTRTYLNKNRNCVALVDGHETLNVDSLLFYLILDEGSRQVDWARSFHGLSTEAFPPEAAKILLAPLDPNDVEVKPDGIIYLPEIKYRRVLNKAFAFGPGAWGLAPRGETIVTPQSATREYALIVLGGLDIHLPFTLSSIEPNPLLIGLFPLLEVNRIISARKPLPPLSRVANPMQSNIHSKSQNTVHNQSGEVKVFSDCITSIEAGTIWEKFISSTSRYHSYNSRSQKILHWLHSYHNLSVFWPNKNWPLIGNLFELISIIRHPLFCPCPLFLELATPCTDTRARSSYL